jgi:hypothetical protein
VWEVIIRFRTNGVNRIEKMHYLNFDFTLLARLIANGALTPALDEITVTSASSQF